MDIPGFLGNLIPGESLGSQLDAGGLIATDSSAEIYSEDGATNSSDGTKKVIGDADTVPSNSKVSKTKSLILDTLAGLGVAPASNILQIANNIDLPTLDLQNEAGTNSTMNSQLSDISRQLSNLLTASQNTTSGNSSAQNDFMAMLAKRVDGDPVAKSALLKVLNDSSTSSMNKSFLAELEKVLSEDSNSGPKSVENNSQINISQKSIDNAAQTLPVAMDTAKLPEEKTIQDQISGTPPEQSSATTSVSPGIGSQPIGNLPVLDVKTSNAQGNQDIGKTGASTAPSDKVSTKTTSGTDQQGSQKSDSGLADLVKHNAVDIYANASADSRVDSQFKQVLSGDAQTANGADVSKPDASQVAQTIIREARLMTQQDKTVVNVKLEPESLGSVTLKVSSVDGELSAELNVRTPDAHAYLQASIPQMKEALQSNGVSLSNISVSLSGGDAQPKQQQYQSKKSQNVNVDETMETISESDESTPAYGASQRSFGYNTMEVKI
ncbi:MAG: flagellar hook-length control protein FliK [Candidatus Kryptoniota bacterium]